MTTEITITDYFSPEQGVSAISRNGLQKYTEALDSYSRVYSSLKTSKNNDKFSIDSAWESGDIYFCNHDTGDVKKIKFDGTVLASASLTNPTCLSVIQYANKMSWEIESPPQEDRGIWVYDDSEHKLFKMDVNLDIILEVPFSSNVSRVMSIASLSNGGCYFVADGDGGMVIYRISSGGGVKATIYFSSFYPQGGAFSDISHDEDGNIWVLSNDTIYSFEYLEGSESIVQRFDGIRPISGFPDASSSSSESQYEERFHLSCIDVDRNHYPHQACLYVGGGNSTSACVFKYGYDGELLGNTVYYNTTFPYIIKVVQALNSESFYLLVDSSKWDEYGYGSSSSSSSSSLSSSSSSLSSESSSI